MRVKLINYTKDAEYILIMSKQTRLESFGADTLEMVKAKYTPESVQNELDYISKTIPSSWEFVDYIFSIEGVSRAFTHQFVRTRTGSYAQQTMRVTEMSEFDYVYDDALQSDDAETGRFIIDETLKHIKDGYKTMLDMGYKPEVARGILPTNISTNIMAKFNLRAFSQLVASRSGGRTQSEYQKVVKAMADEVIKVHPWAEKFIFPKGRNYWDDMENFAKTLPDDKRWQLLKIVDKMKKR